MTCTRWFRVFFLFSFAALSELLSATTPIQTPLPGSVLGGASSTTFNWTAVSGATAYKLNAGNVAFGTQYYQSGSLGNVLTANASNLPTDGSVVYMTLYWFKNSSWMNSGSVTYTAYCGAGLYCGLHPIAQNNVFSPPLNSTGYSMGGHNQWTDLGTILQNPNVTGVVAFVPAGCVSNCTNTVYLDSGAKTDPAGHYCPDVTAGLASLDQFVNTVGGSPYYKLTNIVVSPASYGNNTQTPVGVFSQAWANFLDTDCSGNAASSTTAAYDLTWQPTHNYLPGDYLLVSGNYWQIKTGTANYNYKVTQAKADGAHATITVNSTVQLQQFQYVTVTTTDPRFNVVEAQITSPPSGSTFSYSLAKNVTLESISGDVSGDATCISGTSSSGGFTGTSYTDGTGSTACVWTKISTHAPPQDAWVGSGYKGAANQAYSLPLSLTATQSCSSGSPGTCTVTLASPYIGAVGDIVTVANTGTVLDCSAGCPIVSGGIGTSANTVQYSINNPGLSPTTLVCGTTCPVLAAQRVFNINSVNGTIGGLPNSPNPVLASGLPTPYEPPMKTWIKYVCGQVYAHYANNPHVGYIRCGLSEGGEADTNGLVGANGPGWPYGSQAVFVSFYYDFMSFVSTQAANNNLVCMGNLNSFDLPEGQISISKNCGIGTNGYQVNDVSAIKLGNCLTFTAVQSDWCWNFSMYNVPMPNGKYPILELQTMGPSTPGTNSMNSTGGLSADGTWPGLIPIAQQNLVNDGEWYMCDIMIGDDGSYPNGCQGGFRSYAIPYAAALTSFLPPN